MREREFGADVVRILAVCLVWSGCISIFETGFTIHRLTIWPGL